MSISNVSQSHHIFTVDFYKNYGKQLNEVFGNDTPIGRDDYSNRIRLFANAEMAEAVKNTLEGNPDALNGANVGGVNYSIHS